jgi:predicted kinase
MRRLLLVRGPQGSGKSTLLRQDLGLDGYVLSPDDARLLLGGLVMGTDGHPSIPQERSREAWDLCLSALERRMQDGETIAFDATHPRMADLRPYADLARRWRYDVACLDLFPVGLDETLARNARRDPPRRVAEEVVRRTMQMAEPLSADLGFRPIPWRADGGHVAEARAFLDLPLRDLSGYRAIVHVGDLQGCRTVLDRPGSPLAEGLRDDVFYVFAGDLVDRGIENGAVLRWWLDHAAGRPNVALLWGNHEDHLHRWSRGMAPVSHEFAARTLPQIEAAGIRPEDADRILSETLDGLAYVWRGKRVLCTHAGLPTVPDRLSLVPLEQLRNGVGNYNQPVDEAFSVNAPSGWIQIHGHRNPRGLPVRAGQRSFNLEGQVEFGGHLRMLTLDETGLHAHEIPNPVFMPVAERIAQEGERRRRGGIRPPHGLPLPPWAADPSAPKARMDADLLAALRRHPLIRERPSKAMPHISSLNFTKEAFWTAAWDRMTTHARGLFVDDEGRIAARAYEKFFNVGERPETQPAALSNLAFPVRAYLKENGFLGILGYDAKTDRLLFCSKSTVEGSFADIFRETFEAIVKPEATDRIRRYLRDTGSSMAFEVIDPIRDPHIIAYDKPQLVLLDVIRRASTFERLPHDDLKTIGEKIDIPAKEAAMTFQEPKSMLRFLEKVQGDRAWRWKGRAVEGLVLEDAAGFQFKAKAADYAFWKAIRAQKDRIVSAREAGRAPNLRPMADPEGQAFLAWALKQPTETLKRDIIFLRQTFQADPAAGLPSGQPVAVTRRSAEAKAACR